MRNAQLDDLVERVFGEATLVAAHAWDVVGGARAGLRAVWVNRDERGWPFPEEIAPHATVPGLVEAATRP